MADDEVIHDEKSLFAATGADHGSGLAEGLWEYVDGVTRSDAEGVTLNSGFLHDHLSYPFTLGELKELAAKMQEAEQPLQWPDKEQS